MSPSRHILISAVTSGALQYAYASWPATVVCFLSGVLIDLDHVPDFCFQKKKIIFHPRELFDFCEREYGNKTVLALHSYELLLLLWVIIFVGKLNYLWIAMAMGATVHMLFDQLTNPAHPLAYFFWFRLKHKFNRDLLFPPHS